MFLSISRELVLEGETSGRTLPAGVGVVGVDDLHLLAHLLVPGDHGQRLAAGDLCVSIQTDAGEKAGLLWVNRVTHADRYLGPLTRPGPGLAYVNQLFVRPDMRGRGLAGSLVRGSMSIMADSGIPRFRVFVDDDNTTSRHLFLELGMTQIAEQARYHFGPLTVRRTSRR